MPRKQYTTDLTDTQWAFIQDLMPRINLRGRPRTTNFRDVIDAIFYVSRTGCAWRLLPGDFPPHQTVYNWFARFRDDGTIERIHERLRETLRQQAGREAEPSIGILDSQSVKTTNRGGEAGFDAGKKSVWS